MKASTASLNPHSSPTTGPVWPALLTLLCLIHTGVRGAESPTSIANSRVVYSGFSFGGSAEILYAASTYSEKFNGVQDQTGNYSYTKLNATQGRIGHLTANNPGGNLQPDTITITALTDFSGTWVNADMSESGSFTASAVPFVSTSAATSVTTSGATLNATLNPNNAATTAQFQYGTTTSYGSTATITLTPNNGTLDQNVSVAISGLAAGTLYHFRAVATNAVGGTGGNDLTFTTAAPALPVITTQPVTQNASEGEASPDLSVADDGGGTYTYQWRRNGTNLVNGAVYSNVTGQFLTFTSGANGGVTTNDGGSYTVVVTGTGGSVTSSPAILTVIPAQILTSGVPLTGQSSDPSNLSGRINYRITVPSGATTLVVTTSGGTGTIGNLKSREGAPTTSFLFRAGSFNPGTTTQGITNVNPVAGPWFISLSTSGGGYAGVTLLAAVTAPPVITTQPQSQVAIATSNVTFTVAATGGGLAYQWGKDAANIVGATGPTLTLTNVTRAATGAYVVVVTNGAGSILSSVVTLRVIVPQQLLAPQRAVGGQFQLLFTDPDNSAASDLSRFEVHHTTNFLGASTVWVTNSGSFTLSNGKILFDDTGSVSAPRRFYRVIEK